MILNVSRFVGLDAAQINDLLAAAAHSVPNAEQFANEFSGYGYYFGEGVVVTWDRKRIWILTWTAWAKWFQRPTVCGSMYDRLKFARLPRYHFAYNPLWNNVIPQKTSDISRRRWRDNPVENQRHFWMGE